MSTASAGEIFRLIYASRAANNCLNNSKVEINLILLASIRNNRALNITGALVFYNGWFLQVLEGSKCGVNEVFKKILLDSRHIDVEVISERAVASRKFGNWSMCAMELSLIDSKILEKLSIGPDFDPVNCSEIFLLKLLKTIFSVQQLSGNTAVSR